MSADLSAQINALIIQLRRPNIDYEDRRKKLSAVASYLPLVKNIQNLWLILQEVSLSPSLFTGNGLEDVPIALFAVDSISYACEKKQRISAPTVSPSKWVTEIQKIAYHTPPLFGLVLISGLVSANHAPVQDVLTFAEVVSRNRDLLPLVAACLMRAQWAYRFKSECYIKIARSAEILELITSQLLFTQRNLALNTPEVTKDLGGWSKLTAGLLLSQPPHIVLHYLGKTEVFIRTLIARIDSPETLKPVFFGIMMQLEGVADQVLANHSLHHEQRTLFVLGMLRILQPLGFVIEAVGSQFDSYQYVFNTCLDTVTSGDSAKRAIQVLGERWAYGQPVTSAVEAGDLVLFFEISEQLMPVVSPAEAEALVIPIVLRFIEFVEYPSVFESAHSVMLAYLATHPSVRFSKSDMAQLYFGKIMQLFPARLSASQFRTAVGAVMRAVDDEGAKFVLEELFSAAKMSIPGVPLPPRETPTDEAAATSEPPTLRAALVSALLHAAADYCNAMELKQWLSLISPMITVPFSPVAQQEREFLLKDISDVITSLGSDTSDVGIRWYFQQDWNTRL